MTFIRVNSLGMAFGGQVVLENISVQLNAGDRVGLVGPNGAGKTTLLKLLTGELEPLKGHIARHPGLTIGFLPQHPQYRAGQTVFDEVYAGLEEINAIRNRLEQAERKIVEAEQRSEDKLLRAAGRFAELTEQFQTVGGASAEARVSATLDGLGIARRLWSSPMETLSGGERNLVGLARVLIGGQPVMLLDEPGNHLDFAGLEWLENYLVTCGKTFIIVSHNRYSLDRVCNRIWELERGHLTEYGGNYSNYQALKQSRQLAQESAYRRAQKEIARLEFNIQRLKAWASVYDNPKLDRTAKQFQRRVDSLSAIERPTAAPKRVRFRFLTQPPRGDIALDANHYRKEFEDGKVLLDGVSFHISKGERVAFVGDNGTGKSSLMRDIVDFGRWDNPRLRVGKSVKFAYYSQLDETLNTQSTLIEEAMRLAGLLKGDAADLLHRFLFTRDDLEKSVSVLSGGERARLQLATLVASGADMLLLDEPTNHLDIASREAVEDALEEYPGTLVLISHDRYFLDKLADRVLYFKPPQVIPYDGNFSEFWRRLTIDDIYQDRPNNDQSASEKDDAVISTKPRNKRLKFDPQRFRELEAEISRLEELKPAILAEFNQLESKGKYARADRRRRRLNAIDETLAELYAEWLELGERKRKW